MKAVIIVAAAGLCVGLGGGTAVAYMRRPPAPDPAELAAADSAAARIAADSLAHAAAPVAHVAPAPDSSAAHLDEDTASVYAAANEIATALRDAAAGGAAASAGASTPTLTGGAAPSGARPSTQTEAERLGQIFGTMKPQEAARVLEKLDDAQVQALLAGLSDRKAAAIVASMPAERAAALTRSMLERQLP